ncbi:hypothetical protein L2E82_49125 [Cichorium intybus]|uniref:Uncharacterized protein n=1 Tax=Cichorium intybus TaxID=13427 RepID=A0ACB8Z034_CICIN|nr:hypothetical protein L2E82_49125 [Cichorium intybus]
MNHRMNNPPVKQQHWSNPPAKQQQWSNHKQDGRIFVDVKKNVDCDPQHYIPLKTETETGKWLHRSVLIGEAHSLDNLSTFHIYKKLGDILTEVQENNGECEVGTWGNVNKAVHDSKIKEDGSSEVEESVFAFNAPRDNDMNGGIVNFPSIRLILMVGHRVVHATWGPIWIKLATSTLPSSSKSESSKSTEERTKRRRIRSASSPNSSNHRDGHRDANRPIENSFDLNARPQVPSRSSSSEGQSDLGVSCDSASQEIRATLEVAKGIGVQFNHGNEEIGQLLANGGKNMFS